MITPEWSISKEKLTRVFEFTNFVQAIEFVNSLVPIAQAMNHHPDIEIFAYRKVRLTLTTHAAGNQVTQKDHELAKQIDALVSKGKEYNESSFEGKKFSPELEKKLVKLLNEGKEKFPDIIQCPVQSCANQLHIERQEASILLKCVHCGWEKIIVKE